MTVETNLKIDS